MGGMRHGPVRVGDVEVVAVCEGVAPLPLAGECPGSPVDWAVERAEHPWSFVNAGSWPWHVHVFVVRTAAGVVLVDTGIGSLSPPTHWTDRWEAAAGLAATGVDPADVRDVVLTHLHGDHAGGTVASGGPRFPNARYHVHPYDWVDFADDPDPDDRGNRLAMQVLADAGQLDLDPEDREVTPGVRVVHTPGHTRGHRSVVVDGGGATLLLTGDLLHLPVQVAHPEWPSSHDQDPATGCSSRRRMLASAAEGSWQLAVPHFAQPFGTVVGEPEAHRWVGTSA